MNSKGLFDTVPKEDIMALYTAGRPDYQKVVTLLDFKKSDVAKASNVAVESIRFDQKMPKDLQDRITEWATALNIVGQYFKDPQKTVLWFKVPNPLLGNIAPREMIRVGRFNKLFRFILNALSENDREAA
jgi:hypothetical protein